MHDELELIICRLRIADRHREAERLRLVQQATGGTPARRSVAVRLGSVLVRVGQRLEATDDVRCAATAGR